MAYYYKLFDEVELPIINLNFDMSPGETESTLTNSIDGVFDYRSGRQRLPRKQTHQLTGYYLGDVEYIVDEFGNVVVNTGEPNFIITPDGNDFITDGAGNILVDSLDQSSGEFIAGLGPNRLRARIDALTEKQGAQGVLYRERLDDGTLQTKTARLLQITHQRQARQHRNYLAEVTCLFETAQVTWSLPTTLDTVAVLASPGIVGMVIENGGNVVIRDATIAFIAGSTITTIGVQDTDGLLIDWTWTGTLLSGQQLAINTALQTVTILPAGTDAWSGFVLGFNHSGESWLPLQVGQTSLNIYADGICSVTVLHNDQWF